MKKLTGAARNTHARRVLIDEARDVMALRHDTAPAEVETLLIAAERKRPTRNPEPLRTEILNALADEAMRGAALRLLAPALKRPLNLAVLDGSAYKPLVVTRYTGHGLGHTYRADVPLGVS